MKYVFGGGLSGLVWAYYNPDYTVLSDSFGGFVDSKFGRAFVVLHETDEMVELFKELGVDSFVKELKIGYYDESWDELRREAGPEFARRYVQEKLPGKFQPGKDLELSAPGDEWRALFVDSSIVSALRDEIENVKVGQVGKVTNGKIYLERDPGDEEVLDWDSIVSTLPAPVFRGLCPGVDWSLDGYPTSYAEVERVPDRYRTRAWNLLYSVDSLVPYHRVVRNMLSSSYFVEVLGDLNEIVHDATMEDYFVNRLGVIDDEDLDPPFDGISFLGRYAEWQHDVRIDHVISRAREGET